MQTGRASLDKPVDKAGNLIDNTGFLRAEREVLDSHGWTYSSEIRLWTPPPRRC